MRAPPARVPLIAYAKLEPPLLRKEVLFRARLAERLNRALAGRFTLVAADAGFGKTTLLAAGPAASDRPRVWLRLDEGDRDPAIFTAHLLEGLRPHLSRRTFHSARRSLGLVSTWLAAARLLSVVLHGVTRDLVLVLDDYHLMSGAAVDQAVARLIEDLPPRVHLGLLTRVRPAAGLATAPGTIADAARRNADGVGPDGLRRLAGEAMAAVSEEAWPFVVAQVGREALRPYRDDPAAGGRLREALAAPAPAPATRLEVRCLGSFEVRRDGQPIPQAAWRRTDARRLLQLLLVHERALHREEIMEALWPERAPAQAANHLRVALFHLRRALQPERTPGQAASLVVTAGPTVALRRDLLENDLDRFRLAVDRAAPAEGPARRERLAEAVEMYRGELFAESPYEEWLVPHRTHLARQHLDALAALAALEEEAGRWEQALERWTAVVALDPGAEHAHRGRLRAFLALGRVPDAARAFEECRQSLADLGATPSAETLALRDRIPLASPGSPVMPA